MRADVSGEQIPIKAHIHTINGFSAHAGVGDLKNWLAMTGNPDQIFLVHGEDDAMEKFSRALKHENITLPEIHSSYDI